MILTLNGDNACFLLDIVFVYVDINIIFLSV